MLRKSLILSGIIISLIFLIAATRYYPGGSQYDKNSIGYSWKNNYISNVFSVKAVNGFNNTARPLAICGMFFLCASFALFFIGFSKKIPLKSAARIIAYCGTGAMLFAFLAVTPYHDIMVTLSSTLALISMFYITIFVFKSKLYFFKVLSIICLLVVYCCMYLYYSRSYLEYLPVMQKICLGTTIIWILSLQYFTTANDFKSKKNVA